MSVSSRIMDISESPTLSLNTKAKELKLAGADVVNFTAGEPDFDTPDNIKKAAIGAINSGFTKYTAPAGTPELRKAVSEKLKRENGLDYGPGEIIVSCGGKHVLHNVMMALCNTGDEIIIPSPYWVSYPEQVKLAGGKPVIVETSKEEGFKLKASSIEECVTSKTRAIVINSPNNPTGAVYEKEELMKIADIATKNGIYVISDEIYEHLSYEEKPFSIASLGGMKERVIIANGAAKTYAMTGWRIGWAAGPRDVIKAMVKLQSHTTSNPTSIAQVAYMEALQGSQDAVKMMVSEFRKRRDIMVKGLNEIPGISCQVPGGSFYVFPGISGVSKNSMEFSKKLLDKEKVAVVPGVAFGCDGHIRMSYACSEETIRKGLERIMRFASS